MKKVDSKNRKSALKSVVIVGAAIVCIGITMAGCGGKANAQSDGNQNNGTFEILNVYVPDSIVFKVAEGKELKEVSVYLVSETQSIVGAQLIANPVNIVEDDKGVMQATYTDKTKIHVMNFNTPNFFETKRIKFVADGREMYYDLVKSKWETAPDE
ncbi:MAG: hypothetical protein LBT04_04780 [Prevotellaceae bacterium]|jgi:hypothetical protein|nr:hypothetical protein [Prevotellaceae bacterium]